MTICGLAATNAVRIAEEIVAKLERIESATAGQQHWRCGWLVDCRVAICSPRDAATTSPGMPHLPSEWTDHRHSGLQERTTRYRIEQRFTAAVIHEFTDPHEVPHRAGSGIGRRRAAWRSALHRDRPVLFQRHHGRSDHDARHRAYEGGAGGQQNRKARLPKRRHGVPRRVSDFDGREVVLPGRGSRARANVARLWRRILFPTCWRISDARRFRPKS